MLKAAKKKFNMQNLIYLVFIPTFIYLGIFFLYPIYLSIKYSFTNISLTDIGNYTYLGFLNYHNLFTSGTFINSIYTTVIFLVVSAIIGQMFLGIVVAYLLSVTQKYFRLIITSIILVAWATPQVTAGIMWYSTLSYIPSGTVNVFLGYFGIHSINFLSTHLALMSIIIANVWLGLGFSVLIFSSGISGISPSIMKASRIDGANPFTRFFRIVIPLLKKSIITDLLLITLFTLGAFTLVYVMTGGGPVNSTNIMTIYQYRTGFSLFSLGLANAIGVIIIVLALAISILYLISLRGD